MKIIVDENIPFGPESFGTLGEVQTVAGRHLTSDDLKEAEVLIVRSVTRVNEELLSGTKIKYVGTATIGTDHIDLEYLKNQDICFSSAPGCNAESVAQYVTAALLEMAKRKNMTLQGKSIGVIGVGNTGSRVARNAQALGMKVLKNDPPKQRETGDPDYLPLGEMFEVDFLSLHVPLIKSGTEKTLHLINQDFLNHLSPECIVINSSRGAVVNNEQLENALSKKQIAGAVLDVWEEEPGISRELLDQVDLGTPHIAGYSFDGKVRGTWMIYEHLCSFLNKDPEWKPEDSLPKPERESVPFQTEESDFQKNLTELVHSFYDICEDDENLRKILKMPEDERDDYFDFLRKTYPVRREFPTIPIVPNPQEPLIEEKLKQMKFVIRPGDDSVKSES